MKNRSPAVPSHAVKEKLHGFYLTSRALVESDIVPVMSAQRSFEEVMNGFIGEDTWCPTHVSWSAAEEILFGDYKNVQRAHGIGGRLDRYDRTIQLLTGPLRSFDEWWAFYVEHDATVLVTKKEHSTGVSFNLDEIISLPPRPHGMFVSAGFSYKVRKKVEIVWLRETYDNLKGLKK